jgi:hypothetical protein
MSDSQERHLRSLPSARSRQAAFERQSIEGKVSWLSTLSRVGFWLIYLAAFAVFVIWCAGVLANLTTEG